MQFWQSLAFTETDELVALAKSCEEVGFHGVMLSDHLLHPEKMASRYPYAPDGLPPFGAETEWPETWAAISAMATATGRLRFVSSVYIAPLRHPLELAKAVATASVLSGGRTALGVGVGWMKEEFDALGRDFANRGRRLDEMIGILRALWTGGMVEHAGPHYRFDRLQMSPAPPAPIPILVGGTSDAALRRAVRNDGWIGAGNAPDELLAILERLEKLRQRAGRASGPFEIVAAVTAAPDLDLYRRLEDRGVTGMVSFPLRFSLGPGATLDAKRRALERYADEVIARA